MRHTTIRRNLIALGEQPFEPTDEQRATVRIMAFNERPLEDIAAQLDISVTALTWYFRNELRLSKDQVANMATRNLLALANQTEDLGIAYKVNELIARTRIPAWREPKETPAATNELAEVDHLTLTEVEARLARIERTRGGPAEAREAAADATVVDDRMVS
jgi:AcrR family transcriptional regulator